ncbi:PglD-related sugar-binding protein [Flavobacterium suzhouense]|uniref:PglD N-terminal domain-containing protein n=1 Tax=Flavobacterium suzhouense TaxID=1529638 RepID=A0ABW5NR66_9FLAO
MPKKLVIIGAGGVGREIQAVLKKYPLDGYYLFGFIDDGVLAGTIVNGLPVLGGLQCIKDDNEDLAVILAIGNPQVRKKIIDSLSDYSFDFPSLIHPGASIHDNDTVSIGKGCYIADKCVLTVDIMVSDFCFLNTGCFLQHDATIGPYSVLMPGVSITGGAIIGEQVYITSNCSVITKCEIEDNSIIKQSINS